MQAERISRTLKEQFPKDKVKRIRLFMLEKNATDGTTIEDHCREWSYTPKVEISSIAQEIFDTAQTITDELRRKTNFIIAGYDLKDKLRAKTRMTQTPEKEEEYLEPSPEGQILQSMKHTEAAYKMVSDVLSKQAEMQRDLMDSFHKRMVSLEKREDVLSEMVRTFRDYNIDHEERVRREDRFDRFLEIIAGYLGPQAAKKLFEHGMITAETAAGLSAASQDFSEEIREEQSHDQDLQ